MAPTLLYSLADTDETAVEKRFQKAWQNGTAPKIKRVFKIIENDGFLQPYADYKFVSRDSRNLAHIDLMVVGN